MNLLTLAAIGAGLYFIAQPKKQTFVWKSPEELAKNTGLPADMFGPQYMEDIKKYGFAIGVKDGKLYKTEYFSNLEGDFVDVAIRGGYPINKLFRGLLSIKEAKEFKAFKFLYDTDYKFMNTIYRKYLTHILEGLHTDADKQKMIDLIPTLFKEYFTILEKSGVPEDKWPSDDLGV